MKKGTNDEFSGYEEDGQRDQTVKTPSFWDNFKFGATGDQRQVGERGLPQSWGEGMGRLVRGSNQPTMYNTPQQNDKNSGFKKLLGLLGG